MKDITISKRFNGFEVKVGCKTLVFETKTKMMKELNRYMTNPDEVEAEYIKKYGDNHEIRLDGNIIINDLTTPINNHVPMGDSATVTKSQPSGWGFVDGVLRQL